MYHHVTPTRGLPPTIDSVGLVIGIALVGHSTDSALSEWEQYSYRLASGYVLYHKPRFWQIATERCILKAFCKHWKHSERAESVLRPIRATPTTNPTESMLGGGPRVGEPQLCLAETVDYSPVLTSV